MPCCEISDCAQMSKTIIAVRYLGLGGRESFETAVNTNKELSSFKVCMVHVAAMSTNTDSLKIIFIYISESLLSIIV